MRHTALVYAVAATMTMVAFQNCAGNSSSSAENDPTKFETKVHTIGGTWASCTTATMSESVSPGMMAVKKVAADQSAGMQVASKIEIKAEANGNFQMLIGFYLDANCEKPFAMSGLGGQIAENGSKITGHFDRMLVAFFDDETISLLNTHKFCGFGNWVKDVVKDITAGDCKDLVHTVSIPGGSYTRTIGGAGYAEAIKKFPQSLGEIDFVINGDKLTLGSKSDGFLSMELYRQ